MFESRCQALRTINCAAGVDPSGRGAGSPNAGAGSRRTASNSSLPADAVSGSNELVVIVVISYPSSTFANFDGSMAPGALGAREPADPGTTIKASDAMSAARATTLGSRTTGRTLPEIHLQGRVKRPRRALQGRFRDGRHQLSVPRRGGDANAQPRSAGRPAVRAGAARARCRGPQQSRCG